MPGFLPLDSAPGALTGNFQFTYNGLLFGAETDYELITIEGLDPAEIRSSTSAKMQAHGDFTYAPFYGPRIITFRGDTAADPDVAPIGALMAAWSKALRPQVADQPLGLWLPGMAPERIYCKPWGKPTYVIDRMHSIGYAEWAFQLIAGNPRIYSDTLYTVAVSPSLNGDAENAGDFDAHPVLTLIGPIDTPIITHVESGKYVKLNLVVNAGQTVVFDEQSRTAKLGSSSLYSAFEGNWFQLAPGSNTIDLNGTSTSGATQLTVAWRNARV